MVDGSTAELCRYVRFRGAAVDAVRGEVLIEPPGNVPYRLLQPRPDDPEGGPGLPLARRAAGSGAGGAPATPEPDRFRRLGEALDRGDESILDAAQAAELPDPEQLAALWDGLAEALQDPARHAEAVRLTNSLKAVWLSEQLQSADASTGLVDDARSAVVHIPLLPEPPRARAAPPPPPPTEPSPPNAAERRAEIEALDRFTRELRAAPARLIEVPGPADLPVRQEEAPRASLLSRRAVAPPPRPTTFSEIRYDLSGLSPQSRALATRFGGDSATPAKLMDRAQDEIARLARELAADAPAGRRLVVSGGRTSILPAGDGGTAGPSVAARDILPWPAGSSLEATKCSVRVRGVAEFLRIEQTLVEYRAGYLAHVENVLQGEMKERLTRSLTRSELTIVEESERVEETEREEQRTSRFDMEKESEKALNSVAETHGGVSASASATSGYATVVVEGNFGFSSQTTRNEVEKSATKFSQSVTSRALDRIKTRTAQARTSKMLKEFEDNARHVLDNRGGADHVVGAYRWIDQVYSAQVMNYGARIAIEILVENPGAFLRPMRGGRDASLPEPLDSLKHPFGPLTSPSGVDRFNYAYFAGLYGADVDPPPREGLFVSKAEAQTPPISEGLVVAKGEITIPPGYKTIAAQARGLFFAVSGQNYVPVVHVFVNDAYLWLNSGSAGTATLSACMDKVAYSIASYARGYSITIAIECRLSEPAWQAWQLETYGKIRAAYDQLVRDAESEAAQEQARQGVVIQGRNPLMNGEIVRTELKKAAIWALCVGEPFWLDNSAMLVCKKNRTTLPALDEATCEKLKLASLLESAIDWNLMTYQLLPYYWGDACSWQERMGWSDPDPAYADFLRAGAARVIVPMANGKASALELLYFFHTGRRWTGIGSPPLLADPDGLSAYLESMALDTGPPKQVGKAWEVVVPTTLTVLECGSACVDGDRVRAKLQPVGKKAKLVAGAPDDHHTE